MTYRSYPDPDPVPIDDSIAGSEEDESPRSGYFGRMQSVRFNP